MIQHVSLPIPEKPSMSLPPDRRHDNSSRHNILGMFSMITFRTCVGDLSCTSLQPNCLVECHGTNLWGRSIFRLKVLEDHRILWKFSTTSAISNSDFSTLGVWCANWTHRFSSCVTKSYLYVMPRRNNLPDTSPVWTLHNLICILALLLCKSFFHWTSSTLISHRSFPTWWLWQMELYLVRPQYCCSHCL